MTTPLNIPTVKYNPEKTHFEQALEFLDYHGNPDITLDEFKDISIAFVEKLVKEQKMHPMDAQLTIKHLMEDVKHDLYTYGTYIRDHKQNYRISKEFSEALADASLDVSCKYIPNKDISYNIQFHKDIVLKSMFGEKDIAYRNCYVAIEECSSERDKLKGYLKRVMLVFPIYRHGQEYSSTYDFINLVFKDENQKVSEAIKESAELLESQTLSEDGAGVIKYITNIILYLNSGDPDLRDLKKPKIPKETKNIQKFRRKNRFKSLLDITEVGFNYMKGIQYRVSATAVRGHFRWQPFGPQREQVKLIWIEEHARNFKSKE